MSYKAYEILTVQPDFRQEPLMGIGTIGRADTRPGMKPGYGEWVGDSNLAFRFLYRTSSPEESTTLREFMMRFKGRWAGFFLPSWQQDFALEVAAAVNDTTLEVSEEGFAELTENRPDTEKRVIFALTTEGILQTWNVLSAIDSGGNEILTLDTPVTTALDPETTMMGYCYLVRLADDRQEWKYDAPGQASLDLRMVSLRNKRTVETQEDVEGAAINNLKEFEDLLAEDKDPELLEFQEPLAVGPFVLGAPQGANYSVTWQGRFASASSVEVENLSTMATTTSTLYDGTSKSDHLSLGFDPVSNEILAWHHTTAGQTRIRWFESGVPQALNFEGFAPVLYNTFAIDSTVTAGDAEAAVFYLKPGYSAIFCRLFRDSFATEYQALRSPSAPIYLHKVERNLSIIEIHGMDGGHRKVRWRSDTYVPPVADGAFATVEIEDGDYEQIVVAGDPAGDDTEATVALEDGAYVYEIVPADAGGDGHEATVALDGGSYDYQIIEADAGGDTINSDVVIEDGAYTLTAKAGTAADEATATVELETGIYEQP